MSRFGQFEVGVMSFFPNSESSWLLGKVEEKTEDGKVKVVWVDEEGKERDGDVRVEGIHTDELAPVVEGSLEEVGDLIDMPYLHEAVLLHHIRKRYWEDLVYSNIGPIVLAVNPYNFNIPHYTDDNMEKYIIEKQNALNSGSQQMTHLWSVAHEAYWSMKVNDQPQSILVSGESGAGKTEAAKIVANYLAKCSTYFSAPEEREAAVAITKRVVATSPILEAFGNAKTARNDNSSRFGKFMKIKFNKEGTLVGTFTKHYLLEKSRIITHAEDERSFHTYYQLMAGASDAERERYHLDHQRIRWIYQGYEPGAEEIAGDAEAYGEVRAAMGILGLSLEEQTTVYDVIGGILHFQGIKVVGEDQAEIAEEDKEAIKLVAELWGIEASELQTELLTTSNTVRGETFIKKLKPLQAIEVRDGLSKALYEKLFSWLIEKINSVLSVEDESKLGADEHWIGLLDIFGFENFKVNSLEQMLINLANEQLQNHYNACVFRRDMVEYDAEGIDTTTIDPPDNSDTLHLIRGKGSLLDFLNDACKTQNADDQTFLNSVTEAFGPRPGDKSHTPHNKFLKKKICNGSYGVKHYASDVWYSVEGFKSKNLDTLKDALKVLMRKSDKGLTASLLPEPVDPMTSPKGRTVVKTTAAAFRQSLDELVELIDQTNCHWIRCVKPHSAKKARMFSGAEVMEQLRCAGVLETIKIRQNGFSMRIQHESFWKRFCIVLDNAKDYDMLDGCKALIEVICPPDTADEKSGQIGKTKIFLKDAPYKKLEKKRDLALESSGILIQTFSRSRVSVSRRYNQFLLSKVRAIQAAARTKLSCHKKYYLDLLQKGVMIQAACRAKESCHKKYYLDLLRKGVNIQAFSRSKLSMNQTYFHGLKCKIINIQAIARAKLSSGKRAERDLLRMARLVGAQAQWKLSSHAHYYRQLQAHTFTITAFSNSITSQRLYRQKQYDLWVKQTEAATMLQAHLRALLSGKVTSTKYTLHCVGLVQAAARGMEATSLVVQKANDYATCQRAEALRQHQVAKLVAEEEAAREQLVNEDEAEEATLEADRVESETAAKAAQVAREQAEREEEERLAAIKDAEEKAAYEAELKAKKEAAEAAEAERVAAEKAEKEAEETRVAAEKAEREAEESRVAAEKEAAEEAAAEKEAAEKEAAEKIAREAEAAEKAAEVAAEKESAEKAAALAAEKESAEKAAAEKEAAEQAAAQVASEKEAAELAAEKEAAEEGPAAKSVEEQTQAAIEEIPEVEDQAVEAQTMEAVETIEVSEEKAEEVQAAPTVEVQVEGTESAGKVAPVATPELPMQMTNGTQKPKAKAKPTVQRTTQPNPQVSPDVAALQNEIQERTRQLEVIVQQLSEALNGQEELRAQAEKDKQIRARLEKEVEAERKARIQAEEKASKLKDVVTGNEISMSQKEVSDDPDVLQKMVNAKRATIKETRTQLEHLEFEFLQLEKRRQFCVPLQDAAFHEMVASHVNDIVVKSKVREKARGAQPNSAKDFSLTNLMQIWQNAQNKLSSQLPSTVVTAIQKLLDDINNTITDSAIADTPCVSRAQSTASLDPFIHLLEDICESEKITKIYNEPIAAVERALANLKAVTGGKQEATPQRKQKILEELRAARRIGAERLNQMSERAQVNESLHGRLKHLKLEQTKARSSLKQHRADRDDAIAKGRQLDTAFGGYETKTTQMLRQEEENGADYHKKTAELKSRLAMKVRDIEKDRTQLHDLEIGLLQNQRQNAFYHELMQQVKRRVLAEKADFDNQQKALQAVAVCKVKQMGLVDSMDKPLAIAVTENTEALEQGMMTVHQTQLGLCKSEWDFVAELQQRETENLARIRGQIDAEESILVDLESNTGSTSSWTDKIPGNSPSEKVGRQKKKIETLLNQAQGSIAVSAKYKKILVEIRDFVKSHPDEYPEDVHRAFLLEKIIWPDETVINQLQATGTDVTL
eukprot:TRINITY_DN3064_c0_g1_i1.p1 TRINITY_DN3064_c0_g1~~TRINITY_DN3064_c0_g1_i1.p1  ORF type:complete len:1943 (+),score=580.53 TRINITY_DN3064_c0_g1_i1:61-5889(+)